MPSGLKRYHDFGHDHFVTFSCYKRLPYLNNDHARTVFLDTLERLRERHHFHIYGYVLMPEHVHLLTNEPGTGTLATFLQILKQLTSRQLKSPDQKQLWQRRYYDFNLGWTWNGRRP